MMSVDVLMPRLSDAMEEGTILAWLKAGGESVAVGEDLVEIETDKANMVYEAPLAGVLHILVGDGDTLAVGERIATIGEATRAAVAGPSTGTPRAGTNIAGSSASPSPGPDQSDVGQRGVITTEQLSRLQAAVVRRMAQSKSNVPEFVLSADVDMQAVAEHRSKLKAANGADGMPSINDFVIKASAVALTEFPRANGAYRDGHFELYSRINVGVAVAAESALVVPTIFDADEKRLSEIATASRTAARRVRSGAITEPELSGATFAVSNLGMFGIDQFTAIINPPQAAILAVGAVRDTPVSRDGAVVIRPVLRLQLTCDHRILYGAEAAGFLGCIRSHLEGPDRLLEDTTDWGRQPAAR
jgi:pyruvate dehydrogenase E2 component (dihydrolipoyllysine-residue acetyltransferase)